MDLGRFHLPRRNHGWPGIAGAGHIRRGGPGRVGPDGYWPRLYRGNDPDGNPCRGLGLAHLLDRGGSERPPGIPGEHRLLP
jgi:hypothetical protein